MSTAERTAAQAKADHIAKMGQEVGSVYSALWQQVAWIHKKWEQYVTLFGTNEKRIDLLNAAAPSMFRTVQDTLFEDVLLHLARLTDPPSSVGRANLSARRLASVLASSPIGPEVDSLAKAALGSCEFARDWRNRRLAHTDLDLALDQAAQPLKEASRASVNGALGALEQLLNAVSRHYLDSTSMFSIGPEDDDALSLLYVLRSGLQAQDERRARIQRGEYKPDDLRPEPL